MELDEENAITAYGFLESICNTLIQDKPDRMTVRKLRYVQNIFGDLLIDEGLCPFCGSELEAREKKARSRFEQSYYCSHCDIDF